MKPVLNQTFWPTAEDHLWSHRLQMGVKLLLWWTLRTLSRTNRREVRRRRHTNIIMLNSSSLKPLVPSRAFSRMEKSSSSVERTGSVASVCNDAKNLKCLINPRTLSVSTNKTFWITLKGAIITFKWYTQPERTHKHVTLVKMLHVRNKELSVLSSYCNKLSKSACDVLNKFCDFSLKHYNLQLKILYYII